MFDFYVLQLPRLSPKAESRQYRAACPKVVTALGYASPVARHRHAPPEMEPLSQATRGYDASLGMFSDMLSPTLLCHAQCLVAAARAP
jgi:hypothetical protein